jgi:rSAM/selenodomain-associated transferase 1
MKPVLQVFARAPVPGECKTRLIPALGAEGAAELHRNLVLRTLQMAGQWRTGTADASVELWCAPDGSHPFFGECAGKFELTLRDQPPSDLGARMWLAMLDAVLGGALPVLIGSDCPWLAPRDVASLHRALHDHDCAFVPALDGGYVAVGLARAVPELFAGVKWGSDQVMAQTRDRARRFGASLVEIGCLPDVDFPQDLARLRDDANLSSLLPFSRLIPGH